MNSETLEIIINRRRFDMRDGVEPLMTPAQIAALVCVPASTSVVEVEVARGEFETLAHDQPITIGERMHFLVTRRFVMGG